LVKKNQNTKPYTNLWLSCFLFLFLLTQISLVLKKRKVQAAELNF
jgi:hypothetical protein